MPAWNRLDLTGQSFGEWTVLREGERNPTRNTTRWVCKCSCGTERSVSTGMLMAGESKSCGCKKAKDAAARMTRHGMSGSKFHNIWMGMIKRCSNPNEPLYKYYGARGIIVCERWLTFENFRDDMLEGYAPHLSLERKDNDGPYDPSNVKWATDVEQARNKRNTAWLETPWGRISLAEAAEKAGISQQCLAHRIKRGWPNDRLFSSNQHSTWRYS
jgi:hypothetical protein